MWLLLPSPCLPYPVDNHQLVSAGHHHAWPRRSISAGCCPIHPAGESGGPSPAGAATMLPRYEDMVRQFAQLSLSDTTAAEGTNAPPGTHVLSRSADAHTTAMRHPAADLPLSEEMPVDRSLVTQLGPSCVPMPGYPGGTGGAISCNIGSLSLPAELLSPDYSIPEISNALLSLQQFNTIGMGPQEPWWDVGTGLASPQPGRLGKRGEK